MIPFLHRWGVTVGVVVLLGLGAGCAGDTDTKVVPNETTSTTAPQESGSKEPKKERAATGDAAAALQTLEVKGRAPMTGYSREMFGAAWLDANRNGCDTRNDILRTYLTKKVVESNNCVVVKGDLDDFYTGELIHFVKGDGNLVDIDHVVALGNAWVTGATGWGMEKRAALANDPLNLLPVDAGANRQKGDGDAATWLPSQKSYRCLYVARQIAVKVKFGLWVTKPEKEAMVRVLATCPGQDLPRDKAGLPVKVPFKVSAPAESGASGPKSSGSSESGSGVYYENCDAVRAAGADPIRRGDPGYSTSLDRDGDGVACE